MYKMNLEIETNHIDNFSEIINQVKELLDSDINHSTFIYGDKDKCNFDIEEITEIKEN